MCPQTPSAGHGEASDREIKEMSSLIINEQHSGIQRDQGIEQ